MSPLMHSDTHIGRWKENGRTYQQAVKAAKSYYFSSLVSANAHRFFLMYLTLVNPCDAVCIEPSSLCEVFLQFIINKIAALRSPLPQFVLDPSVLIVSSPAFQQFEPVSLPLLTYVLLTIPATAFHPACLSSVFHFASFKSVSQLWMCSIIF